MIKDWGFRCGTARGSEFSGRRAGSIFQKGNLVFVLVGVQRFCCRCGDCVHSIETLGLRGQNPLNRFQNAIKINCLQRVGMVGMNKDADLFYVIVKLFVRQRADHRRHIAKLPIPLR